MKKLLSILAAASIGVSAPMTVISCKGPKEPGTDQGDFDFDQLKNELMSELRSIINKNIDEDMEMFVFMEQSTAKEKFSYISMDKIVAILENEGVESFDLPIESTDFSKISEDLISITNLNKIKSQVDNALKQNTNFRPILQNGANPIKSGFNLEKITLEKQEDEVASVIFKYNFPISLQDLKNNPLTENITMEQKISIFKEPDRATELKNLSREIQNHLNKAENASKFDFVKDGGNYMQIEKQIKSETSIKNNFSSIIGDARDSDQTFSKYNYDLSGLKFEAQGYYQATGDVYKSNNISPLWWAGQQSDHWGGIVRDTLISTGNEVIKSASDRLNVRDVYSDDFAETLTGASSRNVPNFKEIMEFLENDSSSSLHVNHYNIIVSKDTNALFNRLEEIGSEFSIDLVKDKLTIALFGTETSNLKVSYKSVATNSNIIVELPTNLIAVKQKTSFADTNELQVKRWESVFQFLRSFYGLEGTDLEKNPKLEYNLKLPDSLRSEIEADKYYDFGSVFDQIFEEGKKNAVKDNPWVEEFINAWSFSNINSVSISHQIKFDKDGYMKLYRKNSDNTYTRLAWSSVVLYGMSNEQKDFRPGRFSHFTSWTIYERSDFNGTNENDPSVFKISNWN